MKQPWQQPFQEGITAFRKNDFRNALAYFDTAISNGGERYIIYDSRAATLERLGRIKDALKDSRKVIDLAPRQRHGYIRSARLFLLTKKYDTALEMVRLALDRIPNTETARRSDLEALQEKILSQKTTAGHPSKTTKFPFLELPTELISMIFALIMEDTPGFSVLSCEVCRAWRTFVISRPEYWRNLVLSNKSPQKKFLTWVERSKGTITSLRICQNLSTLQICDVIGLFHTHPNIFKFLNFFHADAHALQLLTSMVGIPAILTNMDIKELCLRALKNDRLVGHAGALAPFLIDSRVSKISSLWLEWITVDWQIIIPQLSCLEVLIFRATHISLLLEQLCVLLRQNPKINKVILEGTSLWTVPGPDSLVQPHKIFLPFLHHLEFWGDINVRALVECLSIPALEYLTISRCRSAVDVILRELQFISTTLREINLYTCCFSPASLAKCLADCRSLESLQITHSSAEMDIIVDSLAETQQIDGVLSLACPQLRSVNFSHCPALNGGPVVRLVKSRLLHRNKMLSPNDVSTTLDEIYLDGCPRIDPTVPLWLKSRVSKVSCVYMTKNEIKKIRR